jgi:hypothetical protein
MKQKERLLRKITTKSLPKFQDHSPIIPNFLQNTSASQDQHPFNLPFTPSPPISQCSAINPLSALYLTPIPAPLINPSLLLPKNSKAPCGSQ